MNEIESKKQFDNWAKNYDKNFHANFSFWNKLIVKELDLKASQSILDVGCDTGILLEQLARFNLKLNLYGVDISPEMIKVSKQKLKNKAQLINGNVSSLPFENNVFDVLACCTSFHHYSKPQEALAEMYRVLKPNGELLILDPFQNGLLRKIVCKALPILFNEQNVHFYSKEQMTRMFYESGFKNIELSSKMYYKLLTKGRK